VEVSSESGDHEVVVKDDAHSMRQQRPRPDTRSLEKDERSVRMYLREMGTVRWLTREGEVTSPSASSAAACSNEVDYPLANRYQGADCVGDDLRKGVRSIRKSCSLTMKS